MQTSFRTGLVWFRRDLRTKDHAALHAALQVCKQVHCVFVFDRTILDSLPRADRRVEFIRESLVEVDQSLRELSGLSTAGLIILHGVAADLVPALAMEIKADAVFFAHDYEPHTLARDAKVCSALASHGIAVNTFKDHVIFEQRELLTQSGRPYGVFTPYKRAWLIKLGSIRALHSIEAAQFTALASRPNVYSVPVASLESLGFVSSNLKHLRIPTGMSGANQLLNEFWERMDDYDKTRNFPSVKGPSYLGVHLRFGTVSIRHVVFLALQRHLEGSVGASTWLNELAWRDFYFQILANFPHVVQGAFKPEYDNIAWEKGPRAEALFKAWCQGATGYPLVDAAMAQLNQTGYMHNRLRMVAGSFLVKHLGLDWRWGEKYFAEKLNDFDLSANNGGWQWVSSSGCDAQPYFRIFNPVAQSEKFDSQGKFIKHYLPQLAPLDAKTIHAPWLAKPGVLSAAGIALDTDYPAPIVDHVQARAQTLQRYTVVKKARQEDSAVAAQ